MPSLTTIFSLISPSKSSTNKSVVFLLSSLTSFSRMVYCLTNSVRIGSCSFSGIFLPCKKNCPNCLLLFNCGCIYLLNKETLSSKRMFSINFGTLVSFCPPNNALLFTFPALAVKTSLSRGLISVIDCIFLKVSR